jgi:thioredoxin reductase (NADPH)
VKNSETGEQQDLACRGVFVAIGHDPETAAFRDLVELDEHGYIKLEDSTSQTSVQGVFACGDVCDPVYKQAVVAAGGGCMAAMDAQHYLEELEGVS